MKFDMEEIRSQLSPGWTPVNIALMVILFWVFWPFGLAMVAYIVWGDRAGLDFSREGSFANLASRLKQGFGAFTNSFANNRPASQSRTSYTATGTPTPDRDSFEQWRERELLKLKTERAELEREQQAFAAQKAAFEKRSEEESS